MSPVTVRFRPLPHLGEIALPALATAGAAGADMRAAVDADVVIPPGGRALIPTGFGMALPPGWEAQVRPRSGLALRHGVSVLNSPGTVDADYRGEVGVLLVNHGEAAFTVRRRSKASRCAMRGSWTATS